LQSEKHRRNAELKKKFSIKPLFSAVKSLFSVFLSPKNDIFYVEKSLSNPGPMLKNQAVFFCSGLVGIIDERKQQILFIRLVAFKASRSLLKQKTKRRTC
jgi:hypothetical protein